MSGRIPARQCAGCRQVKERTELFRVVCSRTNDTYTYCLDKTGRAQGRGAYLCRSEECLDLAEKRHSLERSFQRGIPRETLGALFEEMRQELAGEESAKG